MNVTLVTSPSPFSSAVTFFLKSNTYICAESCLILAQPWAGGEQAFPPHATFKLGSEHRLCCSSPLNNLGGTDQEKKKREVNSLELGSVSISQVTHVVEMDWGCASGGNYSFQGGNQEQRKHHVSASPWFSHSTSLGGKTPRLHVLELRLNQSLVRWKRGLSFLLRKPLEDKQTIWQTPPNCFSGTKR